MPVYRKKSRGPNARRVVVWHNGKSIERLIHASRAEALAYEARLRRELEAGSPVDVRVAPSFSAFCHDRYAPFAKMHLRASTYAARRYYLATLMDYFGDAKLTKISTDDVEAFKARRIKEGMKASSINTELNALQAIRTYARAMKVPIGDFAIKKLPERGKRRVTFWNDVELGALLHAVEVMAPELLGLVMFLANTGCRKGEALALEWSKVDLEREMILIEPNDDWQPKDNEPREIPISSSLLPFLKRRKSKRWVFPSSDGGRFAFFPKLKFYRARNAAGKCDACLVDLRDHFDEPKRKGCKCKALGLRGGPHAFRHSYAARFLRAKPDMQLLAELFGHSHTRTTSLYAHLLPEHREEARNVVNIASPISAAAVEAKKRWGAS